MAQVQQLETSAAVLLEADSMSNSTVDRIEYCIKNLIGLKFVFIVWFLMRFMFPGLVKEQSQQIWEFLIIYLETNSITYMTDDRKQLYVESRYDLFVPNILLTIFTTVWFTGVCSFTNLSLQELEDEFNTYGVVVMMVVASYVSTIETEYQDSDNYKISLVSKINHIVKVDYGTDELLTHKFDATQKLHGCCGVDGPIDWYATSYNDNDPNSNITYDVNHLYVLPESCCVVGTENNACENSRYPTRFSPINEFINQDGCIQKLSTQFKYESKLVCFYAATMIGVQLVYFIVCLFQFCKTRNRLKHSEQRLESGTMEAQAEEIEMQILTENSGQTTELQ